MRILIDQNISFRLIPKILWLRVKNCSTNHLAEIIVSKIEVIHSFLQEENVDYLEIFDS